MSKPSDDIPWVDVNLFNENYNQFTPEELARYAGQYVGWSLDGTQILASGADELEMEKRLRQLGINPSQVVGEYISPVDITSFLG